jgi:hypothetical protein
MALRLVDPLPQVLATYRSSLLDFGQPDGPEVLLYHLPVGTIGLAELNQGATSGDVNQSGCRFLAQWGDAAGTLTSCEMTDPSLYGNAQFRDFVEGDSLQPQLRRILDAQTLPQTAAADFELHLLSLPAIQIEALHLVSLSNGADLVLPVLSEDPSLPLDAVLDFPGFAAIAKTIAAARQNVAASAPLSS